MIDLDDFREEHDEALRAAAEFARRKQKGLPSDRWADGHVGMARVADGIGAMLAIMALQTQALSEMYEDIQNRGASATLIYGEHSKYKEKSP